MSEAVGRSETESRIARTTAGRSRGSFRGHHLPLLSQPQGGFGLGVSGPCRGAGRAAQGRRSAVRGVFTRFARRDARRAGVVAALTLFVPHVSCPQAARVSADHYQRKSILDLDASPLQERSRAARQVRYRWHETVRLDSVGWPRGATTRLERWPNPRPLRSLWSRSREACLSRPQTRSRHDE